MTTSNGLILVDKPQGLTSHDIVARVRKIMDERRVGHAGTLDPMATGLLVLAVGPSTRLLRFAQGEQKRYTGTVRLGVHTDSLDADGVITREMPVPPLSVEQVSLVSRSMQGPQVQTPPMVSALKVGGQRLHALARQGVEVEREPRSITIHAFELRATDDATLWDFDVECSVGTYVRVLLSDLAQRLGTVGHLTALRRVSSGKHRVHDALTLERLELAVQRGEQVMSPPLSFVEDLERAQLSVEHERRLRMGQRIALDQSYASDEIAAVDARGVLVAILRARADVWKPELVFPVEPGSAQLG
ncbi:MAG: tRNA pseudouridine(55) synthase TruB [Acidobacteria bacterium]|nr:tRNA pseudouridine(55) synthase TruB [Acidobacteriota bacterium]